MFHILYQFLCPKFPPSLFSLYNLSALSRESQEGLPRVAYTKVLMPKPRGGYTKAQGGYTKVVNVQRGL